LDENNNGILDENTYKSGISDVNNNGILKMDVNNNGILDENTYKSGIFLCKY